MSATRTGARACLIPKSKAKSVCELPQLGSPLTRRRVIQLQTPPPPKVHAAHGLLHLLAAAALTRLDIPEADRLVVGPADEPLAGRVCGNEGELDAREHMLCTPAAGGRA